MTSSAKTTECECSLQYEGWIWFTHAMHIIFFIRGKKQAEEALWLSHKGWLWWFLLNISAVIWCKMWRALFCNWHICLRSERGQSLQNLIDQLPLARRRSPFPTQCANPRIERKEQQMDKKMCILLTLNKRWHASHIRDIPETKWMPRSLTKMESNRYVQYSKLLHECWLTFCVSGCCPYVCMS